MREHVCVRQRARERESERARESERERERAWARERWARARAKATDLCDKSRGEVVEEGDKAPPLKHQPQVSVDARVEAVLSRLCFFLKCILCILCKCIRVGGFALMCTACIVFSFFFFLKCISVGSSAFRCV